MQIYDLNLKDWKCRTTLIEKRVMIITKLANQGTSLGFRAKKKMEYNRAVLTELAISEPLSNDHQRRGFNQRINEEI